MAVGDQPLDLALNTEVVVVASETAAAQVDASTELVTLIEKSRWEKKKSQRRLVRGLTIGGPIGSIEQVSNYFLEVAGEVIVTPIFKNVGKRRVLKTHRALRSCTVVNYIVSNVLLPADIKKLDNITCSDLNQFIGGGEYMLSTSDLNSIPTV